LNRSKLFAFVALVALLGGATEAEAQRRLLQRPDNTSGRRAQGDDGRRAQTRARAATWRSRETDARAQRRARELRGVPDDGSRQLDRELRWRANNYSSGRSRVIIELKPGWETSDADLRQLGGRKLRRLRTFNGQVVELSNAQLKRLARHPAVKAIHYDRPVLKLNNRSAVTVGARTAQIAYGYTGAGVGVAVIDSGISSWHDDLTGARGMPYGDQRVSAFVDFTSNASGLPFDDNGHGTHVSGTIVGNGYDSYGLKAGMAPGAHIVSLKVLDGNGVGVASNIIAAFDWAVEHKDQHNIRVINISIGAPIFSSYEEDPLTLAAKRAVDAGIVVVAAAGNLGTGSDGQLQYGSITAPANAPWVLTVGAYSTEGTVNRTDDQMARYSSRGPTFIDFGAKPDLVAPGTGTVSLADPTSQMYTTKADFLVPGYLETAHTPYLSLSGTSMASPVVAGSVALMLEANPALTPNLVKAILQYTAEVHDDNDVLTQGAGYLNTMGAVELARAFATQEPGALYPTDSNWSRRIIWGNQRLGEGALLPGANAWDADVVWGDAFDSDGDHVVWGSNCGAYGIDCDNIVWGSTFGLDNIVWGSDCSPWCDNIVWGSSFDDLDNIVWGSNWDFDNIVWGSNCGGADCENVVWGASGWDFDNIVWGSDCSLWCDNIVWGSNFGIDNIVWGSAFELDNIVWGSDCSPWCDNIVWGSDWDLDNIVWGSDWGSDNIVWGSSDEGGQAVWPDEADLSMAAPDVWPTLFLPPADALAVDALVVDEPTVDVLVVDEPTVDALVVDEPTVDALVVDEPTVDALVVDEPTVDTLAEDLSGV